MRVVLFIWMMLHMWMIGFPQGITPVLLKDINQRPDQTEDHNDRLYLTPMNGYVFFSADERNTGFELWKTDGTINGTTLVKDINSGPFGSNPSNLIAVNNTLYFIANNPVSGAELWKSDGTGEGTVLVKDIQPGPNGSSPHNLVMMNNQLLFVADNGVNGNELWLTDGTSSGTRQVKDINPGAASGSPDWLAPLKDILYFSADDGSSGRELWKSDGTELGTVLVTDILPGAKSGNPSYLTAINGTVYFGSLTDTVPNPYYYSGYNCGVWKTNGATGKAELVSKTFYPGSHYLPEPSVLFPQGFILNNNLIYYTSGGVWQTDGTASGTVNIGSFISAGEIPSALISYQNSVYYVDTGLRKISAGISTLVTDFGDLIQNPKLFVAGDKLFIHITLGGYILYVSDGTSSGTKSLVNFATPNQSTAYQNNTFYFVANDNVHGTEIWGYNPVANSLAMVTDTDSSPPTLGSDPASLTQVGNSIFFTAQDTYSPGRLLYKTNGTPGGTILVKETGSDYFRNPVNLTNVNNILYFNAEDNVHGVTLWRSDGTDQGTYIVKQFFSFPTANERIEKWISYKGLLFFIGYGDSGYELWKSDGTESGTVLVKDIYQPNSGSSSPHQFVISNGFLYFIANDFIHGPELWLTDGTENGTRLVKDIWSGLNGSMLDELTDVGGVLYFLASDGSESGKRSLWKTDGSTEGTISLDFIPTTKFSSYSFNYPQTSQEEDRPFATDHLTVVNGKIIFYDDNNNLWASDGTKAGTLIKKSNLQTSFWHESIADSLQRRFINTKDSTYLFSSSNAGLTLWRTNGTGLTGNNIQIFSDNQNLEIATSDNALVYYGFKSGAADGSFSGLMRTDGFLILDKGYSFSQVMVLNDTVYFVLNQPTTGSELYASYINSVTNIALLNATLGLTVYPNPTAETVNIKLDSEAKMSHIFIFDNQGRLVKTQEYSTSVDVKGFTSGLYFLLVTGETPLSTRFMKY